MNVFALQASICRIRAWKESIVGIQQGSELSGEAQKAEDSKSPKKNQNTIMLD